MKKIMLLILMALLMLSCIGLSACHHEHSYDQKVIKSTYRKTFATCGTSAVYYKSCACGEKGTETFEGGVPLGHIYANRECLRCHDVLLTSQGFTYETIDEDTCRLIAVGACIDFDMVIPAVYDDKVVIEIGEGAFSNCEHLETIFIPNSISKIGKKAFSDCKNLKAVTFAEDSQLTNIGIGAFENCSKIKNVEFPSELKTIERDAFRHCINLESIAMSNSITSIGASSFENCDSLESVTIPNSLSFYGEGAFATCDNLTKFEVNDNENFNVIDNNLYTKDGKTLLQYTIAKSENKFVVPNGVTSIGYKAFAFSKNLISITLPSTLTIIGDDAFNDCNYLFEIYNLSNIKLTKGSDKNGKVAYKALDIHTSIQTQSKLNVEEGCVLYKNGQSFSLVGYVGVQGALTIPDKVNKIEKNCFENNIVVESISIPRSVTTIGEYAFAYCNSLKNITIEKGLKTIEKGAFFGCGQVESVTYSGTKTEWENIEKGDSWDFSMGKYKITCSDGTI